MDRPAGTYRANRRNIARRLRLLPHWSLFLYMEPRYQQVEQEDGTTQKVCVFEGSALWRNTNVVGE